MRIRTIATLLLAAPAIAAESNSLCQSTEVTYFSCSTKGGKQVSICGSAFEAKGGRLSDGYLQYRFGTQTNIEKIYPEDKRGSIGRFSGGYFLPAGAASASLSFSADGYWYSVGIADGPGVDAFVGVQVTHNFKTVARHACDGDPILEKKNNIDFFNLAQLLGE